MLPTVGDVSYEMLILFLVSMITVSGSVASFRPLQLPITKWLILYIDTLR